MVDAARQMLDELMGRNRNLHPSEASHKINWEDPEFCQFYNVKFCPHDLFINTRADLGPCARIHDDEAKHLYGEARLSQKRQYEDEFLRFCNVMLHDVDRKIEKGKQRLLLMHSDSTASPVQIQINKYHDQLNNLTARIKKLLSEAEEAGIRGDVDQAQDLMTLCEELKDEKDQLQRMYDAALKSKEEIVAAHRAAIDTKGEHKDRSPTGSGVNADDDAKRSDPHENFDTSSNDGKDKFLNANWNQEQAAVPEKQMKVCEICGAFLIVGDAQQRIEDHLMGKQHLGYSKLRNAVAEINEKRQKEREEEERRRREERSQRGNNHDNRRDYHGSRAREYPNNRHSNEKHRHHHKSHHRSSHSRNGRNHGQPHYRNESREHHRYSRSRSRSRY